MPHHHAHLAPPDPRSLDGSRPVALVTGGSRRVGRAIVEAFAGAGCDVVFTFNARNPKASDEAAAAASAISESTRDSTGTGARCATVAIDLDDLANVDRVARELAAGLPRLDALVHSASIYEPRPLAEMTADHALAMYRVNAASPLLLTSRLAPLLSASSMPGGGSIVAMSDIHAIGRPRSSFSAYSMSKAALTEMVRSLARELAPRVRVNAVAPGVVAFPESGYESDAEMQRRYLSRVPLARSGTPQDAAEAVRWLALDAHYVTGQVIRVDGGRFLA
jgi:pteridine reductase